MACNLITKEVLFSALLVNKTIITIHASKIYRKNTVLLNKTAITTALLIASNSWLM